MEAKECGDGVVTFVTTNEQIKKAEIWIDEIESKSHQMKEGDQRKMKNLKRISGSRD